MNPTPTNALSNEEIPTSRLWRVIPFAAAIATTANVVFYFFVTRVLGEPLLFPEQFPPPETSPMPVTEVIIFSVIFSVGAGIVFMLIANFSQRPIRAFLIISTIVLILSFALPLKIPTPPVTLPAKLTLVTMHIIGAIAVVGTLIGLGRRKKTR
ncbi:MAG TPA: DUF6069 family protein [Anaerolineales bacterium]|nr:DUF6069 family protein [Anaerolineales bacterium]